MIKIENQFVIVHGEKIFVDEEGILDLRRKEICDMDEIIGLETIQGLKSLRVGNSDEDDENSEIYKESYNNFKEFRIVKSFRSLIDLDLSDNLDLEKLPENMNELEYLEELYISGNKLVTLPESIGSLHALKTLGITECIMLESLPENIGNLKSLELIVIRRCDSLSSLPESIGNLKNLQQFGIEQCKELKLIPENIRNLYSLKSQWFTDCQSLTNLPETLGNLRLLEYLGIKGLNRLAKLPESIGNLKHLKELLISNCNSLESLPETIGNLTNI